VTAYDSSEFRESAAYNRVLCAYEVSARDQHPDSSRLYVDDFIGSNEILTVDIAREADAEVIRSCNDFCRWFRDSKWYDVVMMKFRH
jgi:hypothetical protein